MTLISPLEGYATASRLQSLPQEGAIHGSLRPRLTGIQHKLPHFSSDKEVVFVLLKEWLQLRVASVAQAREGHVRVKRSQVLGQSRVSDGLPHFRLQSFQLLSTLANARPEHFWLPISKRAHTADFQLERPCFDLRKNLPEPLFGIGFDLSQESQGQMHSLWLQPGDAGQIGIQLPQTFSTGWRKFDRYEESSCHEIPDTLHGIGVVQRVQMAVWALLILGAKLRLRMLMPL
jgi:hypothetical protein